MQKTENKIEYSKILSTLFCSNAIIALSILCLLNSLTLDILTACTLIKVVAPAAFCFWFLGKVIGTILDNCDIKIAKSNEEDEAKAYEIPSIFSDVADETTEENPN